MTDILNDLAAFYAGEPPATPAQQQAISAIPGSWQDYESRGVQWDAWPENTKEQFLLDQETGVFVTPVLPNTDVVELKHKIMEENGLVPRHDETPHEYENTFQPADYVMSINQLSNDVHQANIDAGWWTDLTTGQTLLGKDEYGRDRRNLGELLCLVHSEVSEAMEGYRKNLMDDKLPHRTMLEVELADVLIRIFDIAGAHKLDLGGAIAEKRAFNASRADHKLENRVGTNGKKF